MYAIMIAVPPRLMNHEKTLADAVLQDMKARQDTATESMSAGRGTPLFVVFAKILGAWSCLARPKTMREA